MKNRCPTLPSNNLIQHATSGWRFRIWEWLLLIVLSTNASAAVWQYSVPVGNDPLRRAYLWIPENCQQVRGIIIGVQNMLEQEMFEDVTIRQTATEADLAIVWITPADDAGDKASPFHKFSPPKKVAAEIQKILADLAKESGYGEIETAPLMPTAHSAATPFVWGMASVFGSSRVFAMLPYKGWFGGLVPGVPALHVSSEYAEVGGTNWGETYLKDRIAVEKIRAGGANNLIGEFVDVGAGHFEWNPEAAKVIAMFIRKAAQYRLPENARLDAPAKIKPIDPDSGWLADPDALGTSGFKAVPAKNWNGDPTKGLWYFDQEMAETVNNFMLAGLSKKPQAIDFLDDKGQPISLANGGMANLPVKFLADGVTIEVAATSLDKPPVPRLYDGMAVGHASGSIFFKGSTGAIKQTGSNTFRVWMRRGGLIQQGSPWEPWIIAYQAGDKEYRRADRPGHPGLLTENKTGQLQTIDFPKIENQKQGVKSLKLHAISDVGLPVQFYIVSGPVELEDEDTLKFFSIPSRSQFPVKVIIGAYQWGRVAEPKVQTAGPIFQEFSIEKSQSN